MRIVVCMTGRTRFWRGDFATRIGLVTCLATDGCVRTGQFEMSFAPVIKYPTFPAIGCVAPGAVAADPALVVVIAVAGHAALGRITIRFCAMTRGAAHGRMQSDQRKAR